MEFFMSDQNKILRLRAVISKTGLSRSSIYNLLDRGEFPKRVRLSLRTIGFLESEIDQWIARRAEDRGGENV
ncbi:MAG: AlpA family transcriptional regulator [Methylococcaceae bacterium]|nr:AlpA family transcriptional regulator [Methylococcaceae bacterium]